MKREQDEQLQNADILPRQIVNRIVDENNNTNDTAQGVIQEDIQDQVLFLKVANV